MSKVIQFPTVQERADANPIGYKLPVWYVRERIKHGSKNFKGTH